MTTIDQGKKIPKQMMMTSMTDDHDEFPLQPLLQKQTKTNNKYRHKK